MAVPVDIGELSGHITVLASKHLFSEPTSPVAEQGLNTAEMAGGYDVRKPIAVDVPGSEGGVADIGPGGRHRAEAAFTVAQPDVEGRAGEPGGRDEVEVAVPIEIDKDGMEPPLLPLSQGEG